MDTYLKNWIHKANEDLRVAEHELRLADEFYIPTINEAKEIFHTANRFKDFVLEKIQ